MADQPTTNKPTDQPTNRRTWRFIEKLLTYLRLLQRLSFIFIVCLMDYLFSNTTVIVSHESRDKGSRHIPPPYKEFSFMHICMYVRTLFIYMYFSSPILHICIRLWIVSLLLLDAIDDMTGLLISFLIGCSLLVTSPHYSLTQHILPSVRLCISATYLHAEIAILLFCRS